MLQNILEYMTLSFNWIDFNKPYIVIVFAS